RVLTVLGGVTNVIVTRALNVRKGFPQRLNNRRSIVHRQGCLGNIKEFFRVFHLQRQHIGLIFHQINSTTFAVIVLAHGAFHFRVAFGPNQKPFAATGAVRAAFRMHFSHQRPGGIKSAQARSAAVLRTACDTPWAEKITMLLSGTSSSSSTNTAPRSRRSLTTNLLCTTSWRT